jgi:hypothetical protein
MSVGNHTDNTYFFCARIQFVLIGGSSLLRLMADWFGMTIRIFWDKERMCHPERSEGSHIVYNVHLTEYCH